jgi:hypothetical protein
VPNLQALTPHEAAHVHRAEGYAWGRLDEASGPCQTAGASEVAYDFGIYVHDTAPTMPIHEAWKCYADALELLARVGRHAALNPGVPL